MRVGFVILNFFFFFFFSFSFRSTLKNHEPKPFSYLQNLSPKPFVISLKLVHHSTVTYLGDSKGGSSIVIVVLA
ncbi:hypothetical protein Hanom_Chr08g00730641 [Helianthus anomalus]